MNLTLLQQICASNQSFLAGAPKPLDASGGLFAVITCMDPRLTDLLGPALGLPKNRAAIIRFAGNRIVQSSHDVLRSVAAAVYVSGCEEILIIGHTDCHLQNFSAPQVIERFRSAGISRDTFGEADLREWFGAFSDVKSNVMDSVAALRGSGFLSDKTKIHGAVIDTLNGQLTVVHDGDLPVSLAAADERREKSEPTVAATTSSASGGFSADSVFQAQPLPPVPPRRPLGGPVVIPSAPVLGPSTAAPPTSMGEAAAILGEFFVEESRNPQWHSEIASFRALVKTERNPERILNELRRLVRQHVAQYPRVPAAVEYLSRRADAKDATAAKALASLRLILDNL